MTLFGNFSSECRLANRRMVCSTRLNSKRQPDQVKDLHAFGNILSILSGGEQTGGTVSVKSDWIPIKTFFAESAQEFAKAGGPVTERIVTIHREHGIELLDPDKP